MNAISSWGSGCEPLDGTDANYETSEKPRDSSATWYELSITRASCPGRITAGRPAEHRHNFTTKLRCRKHPQKSQAMKEASRL
jgi:hypothetical protein